MPTELFLWKFCEIAPEFADENQTKPKNRFEGEKMCKPSEKCWKNYFRREDKNKSFSS
jgi:hypothetical protein